MNRCEGVLTRQSTREPAAALRCVTRRGVLSSDKPEWCIVINRLMREPDSVSGGAELRVAMVVATCCGGVWRLRER